MTLHRKDRVHTVLGSPISELTLVAEDGALVRLYLQQQRRRPRAGTLGARVDAAFEDVAAQLEEYFAGARTGFDLTLRPEGSDVERAVWRLLSRIPYGETRSYGEVARHLGDVSLAQAVGVANARNPLCVLVPCHRVVGADGSLVGLRRWAGAQEVPAGPGAAGRGGSGSAVLMATSRPSAPGRSQSMGGEPFEAVVARHGATVLRVCRAVAGPDAAEDAWSETFLSAMRAYADLPADSNVEAWLVTIAHRKAVDQTRARARRAAPTEHLPETSSGRGQPGGWESDLWAALSRLPDKQRQTVAYHHLAGLPCAEIAVIVGGTPDAARRAASPPSAGPTSIRSVTKTCREQPHD